MKMFKTFLVSSLVVCGLGILSHAEDEAAKAVNVAQSQLGVTYLSTGTNRRYDSRRIATDQLGNIQTVAEGLREIITSTGSGIAGLYVAGGSTNSFAVNASSWVGVTGCRNSGDNCNVVRLAASTSPVYVDKVMWGGTLGLSQRTRVRLFDSRGSTDTAFEFFNQTQSSGASVSVGYWCSSGTNIQITEAPNEVIKVYLGKQSR